MKRIEVKLSLPVVAPLLDVIKKAADELHGGLAVPLGADVDHDLVEVWSTELLALQNEGVARLLAMFDSEFFETGMIAFDEDNAEAILRASAALRLHLRARHLHTFNDESLETGDMDPDDLPESVRQSFMCYVFLATIQELIIQNLDSEILGE